MKKIIILFGLLLVMIISIDAQTAKKSKNSLKKTDVVKLSSDSSQSLAISNDSCSNNDSCRGKQWGKRNGMCRMKDTFIDKDGDGINDNRCKGMGLGWKKKNQNCKVKK